MSAEAFLGSQGWIDSATVSVHSRPKSDDQLSLIHTKSQAGEKQHPLLLTMIDGGTVIRTQSVDDNDPVLLDFINQRVAKGMPLLRIDRELSGFLGVSARTARRKRKSLMALSATPPNLATPN